MSSSVVRNAARALVATSTWPATFVETILATSQPSNLPSTWSTLSFELFDDDVIEIGNGQRRERGQINFLLFFETGSGDSTPVTTTETALSQIRAYSWPNGFSLISASGPNISDDAGSGRFVEVEITAEYERDH